MEEIFNSVLKALGYLFIAVIIHFCWSTAKDNAKNGAYKSVLWKGFLWCAGIALFASVNMGSPSCENYSDPVYGGCEEYADDGFDPTTDERAANFAYILTLLYLPVIIGAFQEKD